MQLRRQGGGTRVIHAGSIAETLHGDGSSQLHLTGAHVYDIEPNGESSDIVLNVNDLILDLGRPAIDPPAYSAIAATSASLRTSDVPADIAEFQWRLSTSVSTLLLGMLGVPLSRARPRQRNAGVGLAILIYVGYYLL